MNEKIVCSKQLIQSENLGQKYKLCHKKKKYGHGNMHTEKTDKTALLCSLVRVFSVFVKNLWIMKNVDDKKTRLVQSLIMHRLI